MEQLLKLDTFKDGAVFESDLAAGGQREYNTTPSTNARPQEDKSKRKIFKAIRKRK